MKENKDAAYARLTDLTMHYPRHIHVPNSLEVLIVPYPENQEEKRNVNTTKL